LITRIRQTGGGQPDDQLLACFVADRDEDAFAALVRRHGPMVWGVCRRLLGYHHDAEDAFQAVFLILAQKAITVRPQAALGPWLYGVAYRVALKAAAAGARRRSREGQVTDMPHPEVLPTEVADWRPLLDRELGRLSERYRAAVVLCDLEGQPRREAARRLGVPESTLASRLTRAHALLARRLCGRGVVLPGAALAAVLAADAAAARVPEALLRSTARVAALVAAGNLTGAASAPVVLMKGVMRAMLIRKLKVVLVAVVATAALGVVGLTSRTGEEVRAQDASPAAARTGGKPANELEALRKENEDLRGTVRVLLKEIRLLQKSLEDARPGRLGQPGRSDGTPKGTSADTTPRPESNNFLRLPAGQQSLNRNAQPGTTPLPQFENTTGADHSPAARPNTATGGAAQEAEAALNALRQARDPEARRRAAEALDRATRRIRERYAPASEK
jgi:RNA polymerase sigma factor (sigma-70 family)